MLEPVTAPEPATALEPSTVAEAADVVAECGRTGKAVRPAGAGTRAGWGGPDPQPVVDLRTTKLNRILEHNAGDFTAVLEAGVALADAQAAFAPAGQWLAVDPPQRPGSLGSGTLGSGTLDSGTLGGLIATADSGPARHRHGSMRDLVIGISVVLSDGTVASAGGRVIKNVAGYDLGKLYTGSYGTLGLIASVAVRLHPIPPRTVTISGTTGDPHRLAGLAIELARRPLEALCLDAWWRGDAGGLLVRFGGVAAADQAGRIRPLLGSLDGVQIVDDDEQVWTEQRGGQRSGDGAVLKVSARPTDLPAVVAAAQGARASVVGRAGLGLSWLALAPGDDLADRVEAARRALAPRACVVLDGAERVPDPWPASPPGTLAVMRRVKARFDPARIFRPGAYVGGI